MIFSVVVVSAEVGKETDAVGRCTVIVPVVAVGGVVTPQAVDKNNKEKHNIPAIHFFTMQPPLIIEYMCVSYQKKGCFSTFSPKITVSCFCLMFSR